MIEYEKADCLSICGLLSYSLGTAVRLIWEAQDNKDLEQACVYLGTAFVQRVKTGCEDKALFLLGKMRGTTLGDLHKLNTVKRVLEGFSTELTVDEYEKICQQVRNMFNLVGKDDDLVYRGGTPEMALLKDKGLQNMVKQDVKKYLDKCFPGTGELVYVPVDENRFGPRMREDMRSAEEMDLFDGDRRVR